MIVFVLQVSRGRVKRVEGYIGEFTKEHNNRIRFVTSVSSQQSVSKQRTCSRHACSLHQRQVTRRHRSPWYSSIALVLRSIQRERRRAERRWLSTGLTSDKEFMNSIKHKISHLVFNAESTLYSFKVSTSSAVKELQTNQQSVRQDNIDSAVVCLPH